MINLHINIHFTLENNFSSSPLKLIDEKKLEEIFKQYFFELYEYAYFYVKDIQQAEDIIQDIFLKIWESRNKLIITTSLKSYLYKSVHNRCIQYLRHLSVRDKHNVHVRIKLEEAMLMNRLFFESSLQKLFEIEIKKLISTALNEMSVKTKEIYLLSRHSFISNFEIAQKLKITEKAVEYHITRALSVLKKYLKDYL